MEKLKIELERNWEYVKSWVENNNKQQCLIGKDAKRCVELCGQRFQAYETLCLNNEISPEELEKYRELISEYYDKMIKELDKLNLQEWRLKDGTSKFKTK